MRLWVHDNLKNTRVKSLLGYHTVCRKVDDAQKIRRGKRKHIRMALRCRSWTWIGLLLNVEMIDLNQIQLVFVLMIPS